MPHWDPAPEQEWEVWYRDMFDRECPPSLEVRGRGLVNGLKELWARYLLETVRPEGRIGFSRFYLRRKDSAAIQIEGDLNGALRLCRWIADTGVEGAPRLIESGSTRLLTRIVVAHAQLLQAGRSSAEILAAAAATNDQQALEDQLLTLAKEDCGDAS
jgi:hypothetical protein